MIRVDTDILEELHQKINMCFSNGDEAWNRLHMTAGEMIDNLEFMALPQADAIYNRLVSAEKACEMMKEMLMNLKNILSGLPQGYKDLEKYHEERIRQISEVVTGMTENFRIVISGERMPEIENSKEVKSTATIEKLLQNQESRLSKEELAAITKILKEDYQFKGVIYEIDD